MELALDMVSGVALEVVLVAVPEVVPGMLREESILGQDMVAGYSVSHWHVLE